MSRKAVYQLSARQVLVLALGSAIFTAGLMALFLRSGFRVSPPAAADASFSQEVPAGISDPTTVSDEQNNIEVYKAISPGVAFITTSQRFENFWGQEFEQESGNGSGSVIDSEGHILTNHHVVEGATKLTVSFGDGKVFPAKLVGGDPDTDLAVIKVDAPKESLTVVPFGDSEGLVVGQKVLAIGNPFGLDRTLTTGVISGLERPIRARNNRPIDAAIQTDASINPGNSGGPLLDKYGRMIGINSQILSRSGGSVGVGFAVPVNTAKRVVPQLIKNGFVQRPRLGAELRGVKALLDAGYQMPVKEGLLVIRTLNGSPASRAGIKGFSDTGTFGDVIMSIDGQKMNDLDDLFRLLDKKQMGETVTLEVYRNGDTVTVPVKLTPLPGQSR